MSDQGGKKGRSVHIETPSMKRVFSFAVTVTFAAELMSLLLIIGSIASFLVAHSGLLQVLSIDVQLFLLLLATGIAFLILIIFVGFFMKQNEALQDKILTSNVISLSRATSQAKAILALFGLALVFLMTAGIYAYYLVWNYVLGPAVGPYLSLTALSVAVGVILMSVLAQIIIALVGRFTIRLEKGSRR